MVEIGRILSLIGIRLLNYFLESFSLRTLLVILSCAVSIGVVSLRILHGMGVVSGLIKALCVLRVDHFSIEVSF